MNLCDACGSPKAFLGIGGAILCRDCEPGIRIKMDVLRKAGKPVNVLHIAKRIFHETHDAGNYLLRDIPDDLWLKVKHRAVDDGGSIRDLVLKALYVYVSKGD